MVTASSPGKVILLGEHAVVYDELAVAAAIDKRAQVRVSKREKGVEIISKNFNLKKEVSKSSLFRFLERFEGLKKERDFAKIREVGERNILWPVLAVIGKIERKYGFKGLRVEIDSQVDKNLGSSAAVFSATALSVAKFLGRDLSKKEVSDFAFEGEILAHGGTPSGIDNYVVSYGGFVQYRKSEGARGMPIDFQIPLIIVDSGQPARTSQAVSFVRQLRKERPGLVNPVLKRLGEISFLGLKALESKDIRGLGRQMTEYYYELRKLGISTKGLDRIISLALENGAIGAKPTGGWKGGCCLVLATNQEEVSRLIKIFKGNKFNSSLVKLGAEGTKLI